MVMLSTSSRVLASKTAILSGKVTTIERLLASTSQTGLLNLMLFTCSPVLSDMKPTLQNWGPGPAESQIATIGRFSLNGSSRCSLSVGCFGLGRTRRVRTWPWRQDRTSVASPDAAISQTFRGNCERKGCFRKYLLLNFAFINRFSANNL